MPIERAARLSYIPAHSDVVLLGNVDIVCKPLLVHMTAASLAAFESTVSDLKVELGC